MRTSDFDYDLPEDRITQVPAEPRDSARLMLVDRVSGRTEHHVFSDLPDVLRPGDLLVLNRSRVLPARIRGRLATGGSAEVLLLRHLSPGRWQALVRPARRLREGAAVRAGEDLVLRIAAEGERGLREITIEDGVGDPDKALLAAGEMPLPPYIRRWTGDPERYQTVYGDVAGSAAAPTAGLHFTETLLERVRSAGIEIATVLLHVGLDTFRPVHEDDPIDHKMHREWFQVPDATAIAAERTRESGGRVIAVGTTCVRTLEAWGATGEAEGWTDLFIRPGYRWQVVDGMITNFHLPKSTLLMLVSAFAGRERVLAAYAEAIERGYRFFSFGDAMLIV